MNLWRSIELRLTAWYALVLVLGFVALGVVLWGVLGYSLRASIDERLSGRSESLLTAALAEITEESTDGEDPEEIPVRVEEEIEDEIEEELIELVLAFPEANLAQIRDHRGEQVFPVDGAQAPIPWPAGTSESSRYTTRSDASSYRVLVRRLSISGRDYDLLLAASLEETDAILERIVTALLLVTPIVVVLSGLVGFYIARGALLPVDEITETASDITVGNLSRRIPARGTGDALDRLITTFNAMLERIEMSVSRIEQFSADASHELRTPISVVRTTAELALRHGRTEEGYRSDLNDIQHEAERLSDLIEVLLTLSRGGESETIPMTSVDLAGLVADVHARYRDDARRKGLSLELVAPPSGIVVVGNDAALRRMVGTLVENALAHTQAGSIELGLAREGGAVRLRVADTGEGIPEAALERIFDRFYRADSARGGREARRGLGLSIARRLAQLHGAEVSVVSREGEGAEFTVHFPGAEPN